MCPDIETFAPLIQATFGAGETHDEDDELQSIPPEVRPPDLRVPLADRALKQTKPVLGAISRLLELADRGLTASEVMALAPRAPLTPRFPPDPHSLPPTEPCVSASTRRRGLESAH